MGRNVVLATLGGTRQRKLDSDLSSLVYSTPNLYRSAVRLHNLFTLVEAYAEPTRPTGLQRSKQRLKHVRGNSIPRIVNCDNDGTVQLFARDRDVPTLADSLLGIQYNIEENLVKLISHPQDRLNRPAGDVESDHPISPHRSHNLFDERGNLHQFRRSGRRRLDGLEGELAHKRGYFFRRIRHSPHRRFLKRWIPAMMFDVLSYQR